jgi:hypothetical protein
MNHPAPFSRAASAIVAALLIPIGVCAQDTSKRTTLSVEEAKEIAAGTPKASHELYGTFISFDALTSLPPEVAELLVKIERPLSFNGLTELSPETAAILAQHPAAAKSGAPEAKTGTPDLRFNGIKVLSAPAAEALAGHNGKLLLHSLERLDSLELAQKFSRESGELRLGLKELTPTIAAALANNRGEEASRSQSTGRRRDGAASILRLDHLECLTPETAEALAAHEGVLVLNGLSTLQPEVAALLAKRVGNRKNGSKGTLVLNGLSRLSPESAAALAAFPGELVLKALTELSPETAAALSKHPGRLHLTGLTRLPETVRTVLGAHPDLLLPLRLPVADTVP